MHACGEFSSTECSYRMCVFILRAVFLLSFPPKRYFYYRKSSVAGVVDFKWLVVCEADSQEPGGWLCAGPCLSEQGMGQLCILNN